MVNTCVCVLWPRAARVNDSRVLGVESDLKGQSCFVPLSSIELVSGYRKMDQSDDDFLMVLIQRDFIKKKKKTDRTRIV